VSPKHSIIFFDLLCSKSNIKVDEKIQNQNLIVRFRTRPVLKPIIFSLLQ